MLQRAAARLRAYELDTVVVAQHAHVVGDNAERSTELHGEIARARHPFAEPLQDACAQRMSEGFSDAGLRGFPRWSVRPLPDGVDEVVGMVTDKHYVKTTGAGIIPPVETLSI